MSHRLTDILDIPHLHDFKSTLQGASIFSKFDLIKAYHQILVEESSIPKTAIATLHFLAYFSLFVCCLDCTMRPNPCRGS